MQKKNQIDVVSNAVIEKNERKGIRELTPEEIELVSGGLEYSGEGAGAGAVIGAAVGGARGAAAGYFIGGYGGSAASAQASATAASIPQIY